MTGSLTSSASSTRALALTISTIVFLIPSAAMAWTIGLGGQLHRDDGDLDYEKQIGPQTPTTENTDYVSDDRGSFSIYALKPMTNMSRFGLGFRYYGTYDVLEPLTREEKKELEESEEGDVREPFEFGKLFDVYGHLEWGLPVVDKVDFMIGSQLGVNVLLPAGGFEEQITSEQDDGASIFGGPRVGLLFGPQIGARYTVLADKLAVRADLGARYNRLILFRNQEEIDSVAYRLDATLGILRYEASLGVELSF